MPVGGETALSSKAPGDTGDHHAWEVLMTDLALTDRDMSLVRDIVTTCSDVSGEAELLPWQLGEELFQLIECDSLVAWPCEPAVRNDDPSQDWPRDRSAPDVEPAPGEAFWTHFWNSDCSYPERTGDLVSVTMTSDFYSMREYHASGMYVDYARYWQVEHEMMVVLPAGPGRTVRLLFSRGPGSDFTDRDRVLLSLLRPHLHAAFVATERRRLGVAPLTTRQREILQYVAAGMGNRQIARRLGLSDATVRKHMENIFARLQVTSRTAAVKRADLTG
jgi:DNA-binding CsgD family transcriptional regulator